MSATLSALLLRGNVTITSPSISDPPAINLGWLIDPADAEVAVAAFKRCRQIWNAAPAVSIRVDPEIAPGAAVSTDADILNYIRQNVVPIWHARSACAMGNVRDRNAVVDSAAKVFGVTALRVVDISAFLFAVPGHPQASVYMLAEKIADDIKKGK
jgi:choline dehydrogenase